MPQQYIQPSSIATPLAPMPGDLALHDRGLAALESKQYGKAVKHLETYLKQIKFANGQPHTHIALARAYWGNRQRKDAVNLCNHLLQNGSDQSTRRWARRFLWAIKTNPQSRDPLIEGQRSNDPKARAGGRDVTQQLAIAALHLSIYAGLVIATQLPGNFWPDLAQTLWQQGTVTPNLVKPLAIILSPVCLPIGLVFFSKNPWLNSHGREVLNYWITMLMILIITTAGGAVISQTRLLLEKAPLILNLLKLAIATASLSYFLSPMGAAIWSICKPNARMFRYPFILRIL